MKKESNSLRTYLNYMHFFYAFRKDSTGKTHRKFKNQQTGHERFIDRISISHVIKLY